MEAGRAGREVARPGLAHAGDVEVWRVLKVQGQQRLVLVVIEAHHLARLAVVHHQKIRVHNTAGLPPTLCTGVVIKWPNARAIMGSSLRTLFLN